MAENGRGFPWNMDLTSVCNQCSKVRAHGNHSLCSKRRQALNAQRRARAAVMFLEQPREASG